MTDKDIQQAVLSELEWEPQVKSTEIGVAVKDGIVTLSGFVDSYGKKYNAERAAKRLAGVKAVVNDLKVTLPTSDERTDVDIARAAVHALEEHTNVPRDQIKITVRDGFITLEGEVGWNYQKEEAESAVRYLTGVKGVINLITVRPVVEPMDVRQKIEEALKRIASLDAGRISVQAQGAKIILRGTVHSWAERDAAERAAWRAPGVAEVENLITVSPVLEIA